MRRGTRLSAAVVVWITVLGSASWAEAQVATQIFDLDVPDPSSPVQVLNGLSVRAIFELDSNTPTQLGITLINTSTGVPGAFGNEEQLLTSISFDFGEAGYNGDPEITAGTVLIGAGGASLNFDQVTTQLGPGDDVTGEWGFGNMDGTGLLANFVTTLQAHSTMFGGTNVDDGANLDGPQAGIAAAPPWVSLGGLGAIVDSVEITLTLDTPLSNLDFLSTNGVRAEFGSDAAFLIPEPTAGCLLGFGGLSLIRRKRKA